MTVALPQSAMDRQACYAACAFEARLIVEVMGRSTLGRRRQAAEVRMMLQQRFDDLEIVFHVGPDMEPSARREHARDSIGEKIREQSPAAMLALPPRVRKIDMHRRHGRRSDQSVEQIIRIATDHARIRLIEFHQPLRSSPAFREIEFHTPESSAPAESCWH